MERFLQKIISPLLAWYDRNARTLPWRMNTDAYRVWVSEIMLQQTRVDTVIPYYERFLRELPIIQSLAEAPEEKLLKLWEGLGYYSRVRNMQKAAVIICKQYNGSFPEQYNEILSLPGIGAYTAGAISSIAFGKPIPAVDGNVLRVITRLTGNVQDINNPTLKEQITKDLTDIYPSERCGDFTQSLMELGALVCLPNQMPKCDFCPLSDLCYANQNQLQLKIPVKSVKEEKRKENKTVFLLLCGDKIAVNKRKASGLLGGLWEFPNIDGQAENMQISDWLREKGLIAESITKTAEKKHIFTHIEWDMVCYTVHCKNASSAFTWISIETLKDEISLPTAFRKFLSYIIE